MVELLDNGARLLAYPRLSREVICIRLYFLGGSRMETSFENGVSHFCEHLMLKSVKGKTILKHHEEIDSIGGQINAYSAREYICFYGKSAVCHMNQLVRIMMDVLLNNEFSESLIQNEQNIIQEEISYSMSDYESYLMEEILNHSIIQSGLEKPVLGTIESLKHMDMKLLTSFKKNFFISNRMIIAVAGGFDDKDLNDLKVEFSKIPSGEYYLNNRQSLFIPCTKILPRDSNQNSFMILFNTYLGDDKDRSNIEFVGTALGSGYSSRLNRVLREEKSLCYSAYSFMIEYSDIGFLGISISYSHEKEMQVLLSLKDIITSLSQYGLTESEKVKISKQIRANEIMENDSLEDFLEQKAISYIWNKNSNNREMYDTTDLSLLQKTAYSILNFQCCSFGVIGTVQNAGFYDKLFRN
ncbi:MAG: insulinase family protein [Clostridium sp.]|jgi:predicted Zn-dependent peptidase|nr:insulinase family protein [Clostridium sp.]